MFQNRYETESVEVHPSISLDADEVLVVYQRERESGGVMRRIQHGPTVFTPSADEWSVSSVLILFTFLCTSHDRLHQFVWHGTDANNKTKKIPGALKFTKLRVIPDQFYLNIDDVMA